MSRDITIEAERDVVLNFGPVTRENAAGVAVAIDLSVASTKLWFTVKESLSDAYADAVVAKTYVASGVSNGITVTTPSSTTAPNGTITIDDTEVVLAEGVNRAVYVWDLTLEEPGSGRRETIDHGAFKVLRPVSDPA